MAFIRIKDYYEFISEENLNQILEVSTGVIGDPEILAKAELKAITRATDYLVSRFYTDRIFAPFKTFSIGDTYTWGDRIDFTADAFVLATVYTSGTLLSYLGNVYQRNSTTASYVAGTLPTNATFFNLRGEEDIYSIAFPDQFDLDVLYTTNDFVTYKNEVYQRNSTPGAMYGDLPTCKNYFTRIRTTAYESNYSVSAVWPNQSGWSQIDNRNGDVVECICHMVINKIHSLINPRGIPETRRNNYSAAISWLKDDAQKGTSQLNLPAREAQEGYSIRFGSNTPTQHGY